MKRGQSAGYTILEVMIFLAVTSVLFGSAMIMVTGQTSRAQFTTSIYNFESQIRSTINDIGTGFFPGNGGFSCRVVGNNPPQIQAGAATQGTNTDCTFLGKVIQFGVNGPECAADNSLGCFNVYTVVGRRVLNGGAQVSSLKEAQPVVLNIGSLIANNSLNYGLRITSVRSNGSNYGAIGFFMPQGVAGNTGDILAGANSADAVLIPGSVAGDTAQSTINKINDLWNQNVPNYTNPNSGILVCLVGGNGKKGAITIGARGRALTTEVQIDSAGSTCP